MAAKLATTGFNLAYDLRLTSYSLRGSCNNSYHYSLYSLVFPCVRNGFVTGEKKRKSNDEYLTEK